MLLASFEKELGFLIFLEDFDRQIKTLRVKEPVIGYYYDTSKKVKQKVILNLDYDLESLLFFCDSLQNSSPCTISLPFAAFDFLEENSYYRYLDSSPKFGIYDVNWLENNYHDTLEFMSLKHFYRLLRLDSKHWDII